MAEIHAAFIDFENYGSVLTDLDDQGTAPYKWFVRNAVGAATSFDGRVNTLDQGAPSGITIYRNSSAPGANNRAVAVLNSGFPALDATVTKYIYQIDISADKNGANASKNDILIRPSGSNFDSGYHGWRAGLWVRNGEPNDRIVLQRLVNSANGEVHTHFIPKTAYSGAMTLRATDDGTTLEVYANVSGSLELIHSVASTVYNNHTPSGALAFSIDAGTQNTLMNNYTLAVESGVTAGTPESGQIGGYLPAALATIYCNDETVQGCWKLDETSDSAIRQDSSGKGNHLETILGNLEQITGKRDNGTRFVHWNDPFPSLQLTNSGVSAGLNPTNESWSMGGWIRPSGSVLECYSTIFGKSGFDQYVLYLDDQLQLWGQVNIDGIGYIVTTTPSSVLLNEWQHIDWVVDRTNEIQYLYSTNTSCETTLIGSGTLPSVDKTQAQVEGPIHMGTLPNGQNPLDADLDEWFFIQQALTTIDINSICALGLPFRNTTTQSGTIGGYLDAISSVTAQSGQFGGYLQATETQESGQIGGYIEQTSVAASQSGQIGGYLIYNAVGESGQIGGLIFSVPTPQSGQIGSYLEAFNNASGTYLSFFDFSIVENNEFDAVLRIGDAENNNFDALLEVNRNFIPPTVTCNITNSGTPGGFHHITISGMVTVGNMTLPNGGANSINSVWVQFGDFSGVQALCLDDNGCYEAQYTYTASGVYIVRVDALDENGVHGSCSERIDLSVGLPVDEIITLELMGTPQSGQVPLTIAFENCFGVQPIAIKEQVTNFGDRTLTHLSNPVHLYRFVGDYIPVWIVKDENGRFWNDSLTIGVNQ